MSETAVVAIIVGVISAVPASISAWATIRGNRKLATVHLQINSRMDQLLRSTATENLAVGQAEGRASADQRTDLLAEKSDATLSLLKTHDEWEYERLKQGATDDSLGTLTAGDRTKAATAPTETGHGTDQETKVSS